MKMRDLPDYADLPHSGAPECDATHPAGLRCNLAQIHAGPLHWDDTKELAWRGWTRQQAVANEAAELGLVPQ